MMNLRLSNLIIIKRSYEVTPWPTHSSLLENASGFCSIEMIHRNLSLTKLTKTNKTEQRRVKEQERNRWRRRRSNRKRGRRLWVKERERDAPVPGWQTQGPTRAGRWKGERRRRREGGKRRGVWWGQSTPQPWNSLPSLPPPPSRKSMLALLVFLASLAKALWRTEQTSGLLVRALASRVWYWSGRF